MKISIIIPVYNVEEYLSQCIESVLHQKYKDIEILLINDASTDSSAFICEEYAQKYSHVRLINKQNGGSAEARNTGIRESTGDYILFLDSDDFYKCDFLMELVEEIKKNNPDLLFYKYSRYYQHQNIFQDQELRIRKEKIDGKSGLECLKYILHNNKSFKWYCWVYMVKKEFITKKQLFFVNRRYYEDILWSPAVFLEAKQVVYFDKYVYVYRLQRMGQLTSQYSTFENLNDSIYAASYWYWKLHENADVDRELKNVLLKNISDNYFVSIWYSGFLSNDEKNELLRILKENRYLLRVNNSLLSKVTSIICRTMGYHFCSILFKNLIEIRRSFFSRYSKKGKTKFYRNEVG